MRTLNLTIKKKWFDKIASGEKKVEYRELKDYWKRRLLENQDCEVCLPIREFDEILFRNGYRKDSPTLRAEWNGLEIQKYEGKKHFAILIGQVLEVNRCGILQSTNRVSGTK
jgi:hypothetical protein